MCDDQDKKLIKSIEKLLHFNTNATDEEISVNAVQFIQDQRHILPDRFLHIKNTDKKAFFVVGSEAAYCLGRIKHIDVIDHEDIKKICPLYGGSNSDLFHRAAPDGVSILLDYVLKNHISFVLNDDSAEHQKNIERAASEGFVVEIVNISRQGELI